MRHLRALRAAGVTDLHLLPVFDFATVPEAGCLTPEVSGTPDGETQQAAVAAVAARDCFNWGYDPLHFGAPEGSYASDAADGAVRIREFRQMVAALHRAGLRVGMDMVYNHTSASGQKPQSVLDRIVPGYYQRLDAQGAVETSTCCDNTATERRMMAKLMIDTAVTWVREYRIDSLRFDLMGHQPRDAMRRLQRAVNRAAGRPIHLIGEGWNFGEVKDGRLFVQAAQGRLDGTGIATFSDRGRDALRGGGCCDDAAATLARQGWINGLFYAPNPHARATRQQLLQAADLVRVGLAGTLREGRLLTHEGRVRRFAEIDYAGQGAGYASQPGEVVNYVENHDNATLFDINVLKLPPDTPREERARVQLLGLAVTAFSQGLAYFHAGGELLRSKSLDRNSFDSGDWFNRLDWTARDNGFGSGLPPRADNAALWPSMRPLLADAAIKPTPAEIGFTRDAFLDLLRLRASTPLFRLRSARDIAQRLRFFNLGPDQQPTLIVARLDGRGLPGARFAELLYAINVAPAPATLALPALRGHALRLHPVHRDGVDRRPAESARWDAARGLLSVPPRTALVYVGDMVE
jgi:pullulanase-type alpha-1,6-glucosidase